MILSLTAWYLPIEGKSDKYQPDLNHPRQLYAGNHQMLEPVLKIFDGMTCSMLAQTAQDAAVIGSDKNTAQTQKEKGLAEANPLNTLVGRVGIEPTTNGLRVVRCF